MHPTFAALTLNPSPRAGEGLSVRLPFSQKGLGDEGKLTELRCTQDIFVGALRAETAPKRWTPLGVVA